MARPGKTTILAALGLVALILVIAGFLLPGGVELRVKKVKDGTLLLVLPLKVGERFTIHYYHSVENSPIWEEHSLDKMGRIYIEEERYLKFGAGMGRMPCVGRMVMKYPYEAIVDMHFPTGDFVLRVGSKGVDHTVIWRGIKVNLSNIAEHEALKFTGRPVSLIYKLWRMVFPHPATPRSSGDYHEN